MTGFISVNKPKDMNSAVAVSIVKRIFNVPTGHMGTLDPMASGVLPIGLGKANRLFQYLLKKEKEYIATFSFGYETDTLDRTGKVERTSSVIPKESEVINALNGFIGKIEQVPPKYSAKCVQGKRGYFLARKGVEFTLSPKEVEIFDIKIIEKISDISYKFKIVCGGGTYIRSIARDLGYKLNTLCTMEELVRVKSGIFTLSNSVDIETLKNSPSPESYIIPADSVIDFPKIELTAEQFTKIINGIFLDYGFSDGLKRVYYNAEFLGVGEVKDGVLKIKSYVR